MVKPLEGDGLTVSRCEGCGGLSIVMLYRRRADRLCLPAERGAHSIGGGHRRRGQRNASGERDAAMRQGADRGSLKDRGHDLYETRRAPRGP